MVLQLLEQLYLAKHRCIRWQFMVLAMLSAVAIAACRIAEPPSAEMTMFTLIH